MEPNVDRGMWSVVALLAAIVIGGVVLLAFPKISGKIANNMDDTVNKAFKGETPIWLSNQKLEKQQQEQNDIYKRIKQNEPNLIKDDELDFRKGFNGYQKAQYKAELGYSIPELNADKATKITSWISEGESTHQTRFYRGFSIGNGTKPEYDYFVSVKVKNISKHNIRFTNNFRQTTVIKPGEAKEINFLNKGRIKGDQDHVNFQFAILSPGSKFSEELEFLLSEPFAAYFETGKYTNDNGV